MCEIKNNLRKYWEIRYEIEKNIEKLKIENFTFFSQNSILF
jgi:hypothetical protein